MMINTTTKQGDETMTSEIIILDGKYEIHPSADEQTWAVVNSATGHVRNEGLSKDDAIDLAIDLNEADDE